MARNTRMDTTQNEKVPTHNHVVEWHYAWEKSENRRQGYTSTVFCKGIAGCFAGLG